MESHQMIEHTAQLPVHRPAAKPLRGFPMDGRHQVNPTVCSFQNSPAVLRAGDLIHADAPGAHGAQGHQNPLCLGAACQDIRPRSPVKALGKYLIPLVHHTYRLPPGTFPQDIPQKGGLPPPRRPQDQH